MKIFWVKLYGTFLILFLIVSQSYAQTTFQSKDITVDKAVTLDIKAIKKDWAPRILHLEAPFPGNEKSYLDKIKLEIKARDGYSNIDRSSSKTASSDRPLVRTSFMGNDYGSSVPCDNDIAVSNDRKVISVVNTNIYMFDADSPGDTILLNLSLNAFADTLGLIGGANHKYDPKVTYDPQEDKFILVCLNSSQDSNRTKIIVGFSKSNDPTGYWNLYAIDGNPLSTYTWSDYPMIALTEDEFFITVNSIGVNEPWETGFKQTFVWQIDKYSGFNGAPLATKLYYDINFGGKPIRNLCPIQAGDDLSGPDIYFLSNRNFAITNDTVFLVHLTGKMNEPSTMLNIDFLISDIEYGAPPQAWQIDKQFDLFLSTNDARILGGYYQNDEIHFVGNTAVYTDTVRAGVFHGRIKDVSTNPQILANIITSDTFDFGYPNISYTGRFDGDNQAIISYDHTADSIWPGMSATFWNKHEGYSKRLEVKKGERHVSILGSPNQRWGDYSGSQRLYNDAGRVWVSGFYGGTSLGGTPFVNLTWIAELESPWSPNVGIEKPVSRPEPLIFPNPTQDKFTFLFYTEEVQKLRFSIYNPEGKLIKQMLEQIVKAGDNMFTFSVEPLSSGIYYLIISNEDGENWEERIVIQ